MHRSRRWQIRLNELICRSYDPDLKGIRSLSTNFSACIEDDMVNLHYDAYPDWRRHT